MSRKSLLLAYLLWFPLGPLGLHRLYLGSYGWAVIYFFTGGLFSVGWFVDGFTLPSQVDRANRRTRALAPIAPAEILRTGKGYRRLE